MQITKGFKYRILPKQRTTKAYQSSMFHLYQAYNICLNLQQEQWDKNKNLDKKDRSYLKASKIDNQ
ncbi:hypothetical protein J4075_001552 [Campylobacter jejuni]|nr:hypothetical protein [Campylobacter jejuni]